MAEEKKNPWSTNDLLNHLDLMSSDFNRVADFKGREDRQVADMLAFAAQALRDEQKKSAALQMELDAGRKAPAMKKLKGKKLTFMVDGSGSMLNCDKGQSSPLKISFDGIDNFTQATGANVTTVLWGDRSVVSLTAQNTKFAVENGLGCGTDFVPTIDYMAKAADQHFIVVGDGDICDAGKSLPKVSEFLTTHSKATIDFVVIGRPGTAMEDLAREWQKEFPDQVQYKLTANREDFAAALTDIAIQRVGMPKKKSAPKPKL